MPDRLRAPELTGAGGWIGVERPLTMTALRGRAVLVHFWSASSVECQRLLDDVRPVEELFADELVVVGVHSPRFPAETAHDVVVDAVARLAVAHPVLDDADHRCFEAWGADTWPTVVLVDTAGDVVGAMAGEGCGTALEKGVAAVLEGRPAPAGARRRRLPPVDRPLLPSGPLAFPGKVACSEDGRLLAVADTAHDRVLVCSLDGVVLEAHTGFLAPQGVRFDGGGVVVCDTGADRVVRTDGEVLADELTSPWDLAAADRAWVVAEAGGHRLLRVRPGELRARLLAGTGEDGADDGPSTKATLGQPSGVAVSAAGVVFADASASSLRLVVEDRRGADVSTLAGGGPLDCGAEDGPPDVARLQCPMGVAARPAGGPVYVADTYNSALRVWDGARLRTLPVDGLRHPGGVDLLPDGRLVVADTGNSRIVVVDPASGALAPVDVDETWVHGTDGKPVQVAPGGTVDVEVAVDLVDEDLDRSADDPPVRVVVTSRPPGLVTGGAPSWSLADAAGTVPVEGGREGTGHLLVEVTARARGAAGVAERVQRRRHRLDVVRP